MRTEAAKELCRLEGPTPCTVLSVQLVGGGWHRLSLKALLNSGAEHANLQCPKTTEI